MTGDLVEFLRARLDEDEEIAWRANDTVLAVEGGWLLVANRAAEVADDWSLMKHVDRHGPLRALADVEAKRRIVDEHGPGVQEDWDGNVCMTCDSVSNAAQGWPCRTLRLLALPYDRHPDYQQEWRP